MVSSNLDPQYIQCSMSVMDNISDPDIRFDDQGVCNYYFEYKSAEKNLVLTGEHGKARLGLEMAAIKSAGKGRKYDCILGLSGGVDSTYLCLLAKQQGLKPLIVHCDNGWNSELAQHNIEHTVNTLGFDLYTYVINWEEFKELQLSYLKASVVDIEVLTDHSFMSVLYQQARKWNIKYVLAGMNIATEYVLPKYWNYDKSDVVNIHAIQNKFGTKRASALKSFPFLDYKTKRYCHEILKMQVVTPLNYIEYQYDVVKDTIMKELNWRDYGGKHYESVWTRFYQGYILPVKFNIDKRKAHYSNLIFSGQLTKEEAVNKLQSPSLPERLLKEDYEFVLKKFRLSREEFEIIMHAPRVEHRHYGYQKGFWETYPFLWPIKKIKEIFS
ncbi:MAG: N-acetyl sugar amidotransferase [Saprospiraceae bacterium]|nr:N-acetyl sugar amidotransferase [Saprospiraceae bacterium]